MKFLDLKRPDNDVALTAGKVLIAEPMLTDPNFSRSVILLCEHGAEGSVGFVINKPTELKLGDLLPDLYTPSLKINHGGPVQVDTLHMLHAEPAQYGGNEIAPGIYWGGSYAELERAISINDYDPAHLKLFVGYSGWSPGQLEHELADGAWIVADITTDLLFNTQPPDIWRASITMLGNDYKYLANMPVDPHLN